MQRMLGCKKWMTLYSDGGEGVQRACGCGCAKWMALPLGDDVDHEPPAACAGTTSSSL